VTDPPEARHALNSGTRATGFAPEPPASRPCGDFPRYLLDPGTGEDPWTALRTAPAERSVQIGGADGATLELTALA
jgi:hypothetical protein